MGPLVTFLAVTPELRRSIARAARRKLRSYGAAAFSPVYDAGCRQAIHVPDESTCNMRLWEPDADLHDMVNLDAINRVAVDGSGCCELDLYVTAGRGEDRALLCNLYVMFNAAGVIAVWGD